jgi:type II secretory pathway pseudopilin PulG
MKTLRNSRGVTLIETVVSLALLSLTFSAIGGFLTTQIRAASSNNLSTVAYGIAEKEMEDIRTLTYNSMASRSATQTSGQITFTTTTTVTPDTPSPNMKQILVQIAWTEQGVSKNVQVSSIYTQVTR